MSETIYICNQSGDYCKRCYHIMPHKQSISGDFLFCDDEAYCENSKKRSVCILYEESTVQRVIYNKLDKDDIYYKCPKTNACNSEGCKHKTHHHSILTCNTATYKCPECEPYLKETIHSPISSPKKINNRLKRLIDV